jgi:two-component system, OmpR family, sensor kinase
MTLSITQRLTILVALLSVAILAPAGIALHLSASQSIEARSKERASALALMFRNIVMRQLDEDVLVDFGGEAIQYDKLRAPFDHWEILRGDGSREGAVGMFKQYPSAVRSVTSHPKRVFKGTPFITAMVPLVPDKFVTWDSVPEVVKTVALAEAKDGVFLSAKTGVSGDRNVIAIKWLLSDRILEVTVTDAGEFIEMDPEDLPSALPAGMVIRASSGQIISGPQIVGWQAYNGELIAIVEGRLPTGQRTRVAINRIGEQHSIGQDGTVSHMLPGSQLWAVVAYDMSQDVADTWQIDAATTVGGVSVWLLMVLIAWQVTRRALRPVKEIVLRAERIKPSHLGERLPVGRADDELSKITKTVNEMLDRIEAGYQRERQFTGDVSHELRNPLAKMRVELDLALSGSQEDQNFEETLKRLEEYVEGMQRLTDSLLMLARLEGRLEQVEMDHFDIVDLSVEIINGFAEHSGQRVQLELGTSSGPLEVIGNRQMVGILLRNLLDNALRYSASQSPVFLRIGREQNAVRVEVEDDGPGIPEGQIELAFNRFRRLEPSRSRRTGGIGLGLSIAKAIADLHGTTVTLGRGTKRGTLASFTLASSSDKDTAQPQAL